jgi:drug/metabolite transporter (DMT)-like permease
MNLDELISVWRTQDSAPLHGVNKTLLHLALRRDEAKLQRERLMERWIVSIACIGVLISMAFFLAIMSFAHERNSVSAWDFVLAIAGCAIALLTGCVIYASYKNQRSREQCYSESLRDQLNRRIAQLEDYETKKRLIWITIAFAGICPVMILILSWRVNGKSIEDDGYMILWLIVMTLFGVVTGIWEYRRQAQSALPQKQRLQELLEEIDGQ